MAKLVQLRVLTRGEHRIVRTKLKDLSCSARVHQRYRLIAWLRTGMGARRRAQRCSGYGSEQS